MIITMGSLGARRKAWSWSSSQELTSWSTNIRKNKAGPSEDFWNLQALPKKHTSFYKAVPSNPSQAVPRTGLRTMLSNTWSYAGVGVSIQTLTTSIFLKYRKLYERREGAMTVSFTVICVYLAQYPTHLWLYLGNICWVDKSKKEGKGEEEDWKKRSSNRRMRRRDEKRRKRKHISKTHCGAWKKVSSKGTVRRCGFDRVGVALLKECVTGWAGYEVSYAQDTAQCVRLLAVSSLSTLAITSPAHACLHTSMPCHANNELNLWNCKPPPQLNVFLCQSDCGHGVLHNNRNPS